MAEKNKYSKMLRVIATTLESLNGEQLEALMSGKAKLIYEPVKNSLTEKQPKFTNDFDDIIDRLSNCQDRDEARKILSDIPNKEILISIAKTQKIHVIKSDRREDIEDKLIEFIIGAKLRTEAIHSLNLKGGSGNS